jgi:hypothetical protein
LSVAEHSAHPRGAAERAHYTNYKYADTGSKRATGNGHAEKGRQDHDLTRIPSCMSAECAIRIGCRTRCCRNWVVTLSLTLISRIAISSRGRRRGGFRLIFVVCSFQERRNGCVSVAWEGRWKMEATVELSSGGAVWKKANDPIIA